MLINSISGRTRSVRHGLMVTTILFLGVAIADSTLLLWNRYQMRAASVGVGAGCGIVSVVRLLVLARLQRIEQAKEKTALDLDHTHGRVLRRILLPHLYRANGTGAAFAYVMWTALFNVTCTLAPRPRHHGLGVLNGPLGACADRKRAC